MAEARRLDEDPAPEQLPSRDPANGRVLGHVQAATAEDVEAAVARAREAAPAWAALSHQARARYIKRLRHTVADRVDELAETVSQECGKPVTEAFLLDVLPAVAMLSYMERKAGKALRPMRLEPTLGRLAGTFSRVEYQPYGVVGCITPWNYPITNCFLAFLPALVAGNAVVIKPSEVTPQTGRLIGDLLGELPAGVGQVVQGSGEVGAALIDAGCDKISFIGSPVTGREVAKRAAEHLIPVVMELGGNDAALVLGDADLDLASSGVLWGSMFNSGQTCCSIERVYVIEDIAESFQDHLLRKLERLRIGKEGDIGALTHEQQRAKVESHVRDAMSKGARLHSSASTPGGPGLWYPPTIVTDVADGMAVVHEESFGPVVTLTAVATEEEAVARANQEGVNLTASVWSRDRDRAAEIALGLRAGSVGVNAHGDLPGVPWAPWGGRGGSGYGRLNGTFGIREFTVPVHIATATGPVRKKLWWFPYDDDTRRSAIALISVLGARSAARKAWSLGRLALAARRALKNKL